MVSKELKFEFQMMERFYIYAKSKGYIVAFMVRQGNRVYCFATPDIRSKPSEGTALACDVHGSHFRPHGNERPERSTAGIVIVNV